MSQKHILYGWQLSYFSGKARAYLRFKQIPFRERAVDAYTLLRRIPRKTGASPVMPVVVTPQGEWLQDTTHIIDVLEARFPTPSAYPGSAGLQVLARLLEAWADEWWVPIAMHYRWSYPENEALFVEEAGRALLPYAPGFLQRQAARRPVKTLTGYLPGVGVIPEQLDLMERWTESMLDALDAHFAEHPFLLGGRASVADFALIGPMYAHLARDPWPKRELIETRPHLKAWVARAHGGEAGHGAPFALDALPETLTPVLKSLATEFLPMVRGIRDAVAQQAESEGTGKSKLPRMLSEIRFPMADGQFKRFALPYTLWMMQRARHAFDALDASERDAVSGVLERAGDATGLAMDMGPPLRRKGLRAAWADAA